MAIQLEPVTPPASSSEPQVKRLWKSEWRELPLQGKGMIIGVFLLFLSTMLFSWQGRSATPPTSTTASVLTASKPTVDQAAEEREATVRMQQEMQRKIEDQRRIEAANAATTAPSAALMASPVVFPLAGGVDALHRSGGDRGSAAGPTSSGEQDDIGHRGAAASKPLRVSRRPGAPPQNGPATAVLQSTTPPTATDPADVPAWVQNVLPGLVAPALRQEPPAPPTPAAAVRPDGHVAGAMTARPTTLREGTVIDTRLANRLNGTAPGPVTARVSNPIYGYDGTRVLIPQGATMLGTTTAVKATGESRLAVTFHRLQMPPPDGRSYELLGFKGLSQIGDVGLRDRVNNHYLSTFGAAALIGVINGTSQWIGQIGSHNSGVILGGIGTNTDQAATSIMQQFTNRVPSLIIEAGTPVKVHVMTDLELPVWIGRY
ncbi:MAG: TrbI/VirB10 family protein [Acidobacteriota bacterium]